jgi:hypothetical protein
MSLALRRALLVTFLAAIALVAPAVRAGEAECAPAYEDAQLLRRQGKLVAAREAAATCARPSCPSVARKDCEKWVEQIAREIPSVTIIARETGTGADARARVIVDGAWKPDASAGRAIELDPGPHVVRVEREGDEPAEQTLTLFQGEGGRIVRVELRRVGQPSPPPREAPMPPPEHSHTYVPAVVLGGFSLAALAASAALGLSGRSDLSGLRSSCAPNCTDEQVDPVRRKLIVSDVALGIGVLGTVATIYFIVRPPSTGTSAQTRLELAPSRAGGTLSLRAFF